MAPCPSSPRRDAAAVRMRIGAVVACLLIAGSAPAFAASDVSPALPVAATLSAANASPTRSVRVFRIYGWRTLEPRTAVIWLGVDEPYLLKVRGDCRDVGDSAPAALALRDTHLVPGRDRLQFASGPCVIDSLVRADRNKLRASSITPDATSVIRLIQEAPPRKSR